jgi:hypothetical protein
VRSLPPCEIPSLVERHDHEFVAVREAAGRPLPKYVQNAFDQCRLREARDQPAALTQSALRAVATGRKRRSKYLSAVRDPEEERSTNAGKTCL